MSSALKEAELIVDTLSRDELDQLQQYIESAKSGSDSYAKTLAAWERLKQLGADMSAQSTNGPSLMEILTEMRNARDVYH